MSSFKDELEEIRVKYKPQNVEILFVGESRPHSGKFFYYENTDLYRYTKKAFQNAGINFSLDKFKDYGCWLYDVCNLPVNNDRNTPKGKEFVLQQINEGLPNLVNFINKLKPHYIIVIKKGEMKKIVYSKICDIGYLDGKTAFNTPFPGTGNQKKYVYELTKILEYILK